MATVLNNFNSAIYSSETTPFANGESVDTGYLDIVGFGKYQVSFDAPVAGLTYQIFSRSSPGSIVYSTPINTFEDGTLFLATLPARERYIRLVVTNNTGSEISAVSVNVKGTNSEGASVFPLSLAPGSLSGAMLTQSVLIGKDASGSYRNIATTDANALLTSDFGIEVSRGNIVGYEVDTKFGRNPLIDTTSDPEDIWNVGGDYTGFNATQDENIEVSSSSASDVGTLVSSGTSTGGSTTTLADSGATFVTDGVVAGDIVINDTKAIHGYITAVTETTLTVFQFENGFNAGYSSASGDSYRVVAAASTGAAVVRWFAPLDSNYIEQGDFYTILNGTNWVTSVGNYYRLARGRVVHTGSSGSNIGEITCRQATTTANIFATLPTFGGTTVAAFTVPAGKLCIVTKVSASIARSGGTPGSAVIVLLKRPAKSLAFSPVRVYDVQTGQDFDREYRGGIPFPPGADVKFRAISVSDNGTSVEAEVEYYLIDI